MSLKVINFSVGWVIQEDGPTGLEQPQGHCAFPYFNINYKWMLIHGSINKRCKK